MSVIRATVRDGKIVGDAPADWPEGMTLDVRPTEERWGLTEEEWPTTPEAFEEWLQQYDALEPLVFTAEDEERIAADRRERNEWLLAHADERDRKLRELFE